jgi:hypothetical protein
MCNECADVKTVPNASVVQEWITALRSGEYKQTQGVLNRVESTAFETPQVGFCCLGVLCDLAVKAGVIDSGEVHSGVTYYDNERGTLPLAVQEWAGVDAKGYYYPNDDLGEATNLVTHNDSDMMDFNGIADIVEEYFLPKS